MSEARKWLNNLLLTPRSKTKPEDIERLLRIADAALSEAINCRTSAALFPLANQDAPAKIKYYNMLERPTRRERNR